MPYIQILTHNSNPQNNGISDNYISNLNNFGSYVPSDSNQNPLLLSGSELSAIPINYNSYDGSHILYVTSLRDIVAVKISHNKIITELWRTSLESPAQCIVPNITLSKDGNRLYVTHNENPYSTGKISILNTLTGTIEETFEGCSKYGSSLMGYNNSTLRLSSASCYPVILDEEGHLYVCFWQRSTANYSRSIIYKLDKDNFDILFSTVLKSELEGVAYGCPLRFSNIVFSTQKQNDYYKTYILYKQTDETYLAMIKSTDGTILYNYGISASASPSGITYNYANSSEGITDRVYVSTNQGLFAYDASNLTLKAQFRMGIEYLSSLGYSACSVAINNNIIYYQTSKALFALKEKINGTFQVLWTYDKLPYYIDSTYSQQINTAAPILDVNGLIITTSATPSLGASANIHIFEDKETYCNLKYSGSAGIGSGIKTKPALGSNGLLFLNTYSILDRGAAECTNGTNAIYAFGEYSQINPNTTTTSSSSSTTSTTSSTSSTTSTTSSTTTATTTRTTTTLGPLNSVTTTLYYIINNQIVQMNSSNSSDNSTLTNNAQTNSFNVGSIAPGETSLPIIFNLNIPYAKSTTNLKIALIDNGTIPFTNTTFGILVSPELRDDLKPYQYIQGVNNSKSPTSQYNIDVPMLTNYLSEYVYITVKIPSNATIGSGSVRFKWFFDYAD